MTEQTTPSFGDLVRVSARIGFLSFGGPAGQIALMHKELVEDRKWVDDGAFLRALNLCHLLPGPEAQQLATWIGWKLHGLRGGLAAGMLFVIPGALVMLGLSILYVLAANLGWFAALFLGIKAAVLAIVAQALIRVAGRALKTDFQRWLAVAAFIGLFFLALPFPMVVFGAGALGAIVSVVRPAWLPAHKAKGDAPPPGSAARLWRSTAATVALWIGIWAAPMLLVLVTLGRDHVLWDIGAFFSQLAIVTFGGAYAVLAYMAQEAVQSMQWLNAREMADGLGLAETTPGPLIMVTQYVGFLGAYRDPAPFSPMLAGVLGAGLTTWVTFAPCFLWIFAVAPWMERLERARHLQAALAAITAAVVGVIANLALWFAIHVLFTRFDSGRASGLPFDLPVWASFDWRVAVLATIAAVLLFGLKRSVMTVLAVSALGGLLLARL